MKRVIALLMAGCMLFLLASCEKKQEETAAGIEETTQEIAASAAKENTEASLKETEEAPESAEEGVEVQPEGIVEVTEEEDIYARYTDSKKKAEGALWWKLVCARTDIYVYKDFSSVENHFTQKAKMAGWNADLVKDMDENWPSGSEELGTCIRCSQTTSGNDWGGWLFLNGTLEEGSTVPALNTGSRPGEGMDLSASFELTFYAKGEKGGEIVEFFTGGYGYDGETNQPMVACPDSCTKQSLGFVELTDDWASYVIDLTGQDLSSIACGFGYVMSGSRSGNKDNVFYLDEICFHGYNEDVKPMLASYNTENRYIQGAAFTYDNALTAMAFISEDEQEDAKEMLDSFVYAVENDRYKPGRIRNAYVSGDIRAFPGWASGARLPGWYDNQDKAWYEDRYQVGCNVGNTSYAALALLAYDTAYGNEKYVDTAARLMDWVLEECSDENCGFLAGFDGWPEGSSPVVYPFTYKSTEHNIDAYAAFRSLYEKTGEEKYAKAAQSALEFIKSMYDEEQKLFWTGTLDDGVTPNKSNIVLDTQVWTALALGEEFEPYREALETAYRMKTPDGGYPFCMGGGEQGWWPEGASFTALTWRMQGEEEKALETLDALAKVQHDSGMFPAATAESIPTGFELFDGSPWNYTDDEHIAPTAWFILAVSGFNPYEG